MPTAKFKDHVSFIKFCLGVPDYQCPLALVTKVTSDRSKLMKYVEALEKQVAPSFSWPVQSPVPGPESVPTLETILEELLINHQQELWRKSESFDGELAKLKKKLMKIATNISHLRSQADELPITPPADRARTFGEQLSAAVNRTEGFSSIRSQIHQEQRELERVIEKIRLISKNFERWKAEHERKNIKRAANKRMDELRLEVKKKVDSATKENNALIAKAKTDYDRQVNKFRQSTRGRILSGLKSDIQSGRRLNITGRVSWKLLPSGKIRITKLHDYLNSVKLAQQEVDEMRLQLLLRQNPDEIYTGRDDFNGYLVFVYKRTGIAVLDCPFVGNAVYAFGEDWRLLSQRTKQELLAHTHNWRVKRFVHRGDWKNRLIMHIRSPSW